MRRFVFLLAAITVTLGGENCEIEQAIITPVPPHTVTVVAAMTCGGIRCWERWVDVDGKRVRQSKVCMSEAPYGGSGEELRAVPLP